MEVSMQTHVQLAGMLGTTELFIILGIVILLFGGSKLPVLGRSLGEGINNFRRSFKGQDESEIEVVEIADTTEESEASAKIEDQSSTDSSTKG